MREHLKKLNMSEDITKRCVYDRLFRDNQVYNSIVKTPTIYRGKKSIWSQSIAGENALEAIANAFGITGDDKKIFSNAYYMAISGDGYEGEKNSIDTPKIQTIHSSALLPLLCFFEVNNGHPIEIGGTLYTKVFFEVQNDVRCPSDHRHKHPMWMSL